MKHETVALIIMSDGNRTVVEARSWSSYGECTTGAGSSSREPGDKSRPETGEDLATARALRSMAAHLEKRASGRMKHAEDIKKHRAEIAVKNQKAEEAVEALREKMNSPVAQALRPTGFPPGTFAAPVYGVGRPWGPVMPAVRSAVDMEPEEDLFP